MGVCKRLLQALAGDRTNKFPHFGPPRMIVVLHDIGGPIDLTARAASNDFLITAQGGADESSYC